MSILFRFHGNNAVPAEVFERFLLSSTAVAAVIASTKDKEPYTAIVRQELKAVSNAVAAMQKLENMGKTKDMAFFFYSPSSKDSLQPFTIAVNAQNKPAVVAFAHGENAKTEVEEYLAPKILDMYTSHGGDLARLYTAMEQKVFRRDIDNWIAENELKVLVYFGDGNSLFYGPAGAAGEDTEWGWTTGSLTDDAPADAGDTAAEETEDDLETQMQLALGNEEAPKDPPAETPVPKVPKPATQPVTKPPAMPQAVKKPIASTQPVMQTPKAKPTGEKVTWVVPKDMRESDVPRAILKFQQTLPADWQQRFRNGTLSIEIPRARMGEAMDLKKTLTAVPKDAGTPVAKPKTPVNPDGDTTTKEGVNEIVENFLPSVSIGLVDVKGEAMHDPKFLEGFEEERESIMTRIGLPGIASMFGWTKEDIHRATHDYETSADFSEDMIFWLKAELVKAYQQLYPAKKGTPQPRTQGMPTLPKMSQQRRAG